MDELLRELERLTSIPSGFTLADAAVVLASSFLFSLVLGLVYRFTHRGADYSQSFAQTLVLMAMGTGLIMLIIGSNIARAFSLLGALSVIRFRNAVKETRDVGFMFLAMAVGMACGTRYFLLAAFATTVLAAVLVAMFKLDLLSKHSAERILRVRLPPGADADDALERVFSRFLQDRRFISLETVSGGVLQEVVYGVVLRSEAEVQPLLEALRAVNGNNKVVLMAEPQGAAW